MQKPTGSYLLAFSLRPNSGAGTDSESAVVSERCFGFAVHTGVK